MLLNYFSHTCIHNCYSNSVVQSCDSFKRSLASCFSHSIVPSERQLIALLCLMTQPYAAALRDLVPQPHTHRYKQHVSNYINNLLAFGSVGFVDGSTWHRIPLGILLWDKTSLPLFPIPDSHFVDLTLAIWTRIFSSRLTVLRILFIFYMSYHIRCVHCTHTDFLYVFTLMAVTASVLFPLPPWHTSNNSLNRFLITLNLWRHIFTLSVYIIFRFFPYVTKPS
jgi:hypothetical protein